MNMLGICKDYVWNMHGIGIEYAWNMHEAAWSMQGIMGYAQNMLGMCLTCCVGSEGPARPETRALGQHSEEMLERM